MLKICYAYHRVLMSPLKVHSHVLISFHDLHLFHRLQMSNTFYESAGQNWFTLDSVHIHYNWSHEATFNATEVYAPATHSYHCQHVSSLQKYDTLLVPSSHTDSSANWHITFTDFQIQAFNVQSNKFASASDCATFFTPAILMGLITSLILLLVLAYALHMVVHLKHIDRYEDSAKVTVSSSCNELHGCWRLLICQLQKNVF
uniref:ATPase H+ transporting accessory protein 1 like b n=1 Tax=Electrophorus electricus TaxID=8005 RepID=A0A4W4EKH1_ELEEL